MTFTYRLVLYKLHFQNAACAPLGIFCRKTNIELLQKGSASAIVETKLGRCIVLINHYPQVKVEPI